jgi:DNA-binding MarR family transcriptional regulator
VSVAGLDPLIHAPVRLQICAILSAADEAEFALVREETGVSESVLSKQVKLLADAGYVKVRKASPFEAGLVLDARRLGAAQAHKTTVSARQRTWLSLTKAGRSAFAVHMQALTALVATAANGIAVE